MSVEVPRCQACGRSAGQGEQFLVCRPTRSALTPNRDPTPEDLLCPHCAARRRQSGEFELAYRFCYQCAGPIEPGEGEWRSRSETSVAGPLPSTRTFSVLLCRACVRRYDGTARWLMGGLAFFAAGVALLALVGRFLR
jgi:hypothetical protein